MKMQIVPVVIEPMIHVEGFGGEVYEARTYAMVVDKMRAASWGGDLADGPKGYMKQVAKRVFDWSGRIINSEKAKEFLQDLAETGLIKIRKIK
jgi:hypothetical protein